MGKKLFSDIAKINECLGDKLSKEPHLEKINGETWYINPLTGIKKLIRDRNGNKVNEIGD
ncbi:hypothetical protein RHO12_07800 [Orbus sturtevantii]|uniref:hypothetical protein n=1 Tax=Orbus sturtevantii TaxID=3074109 RepID=UPI00370DC4DE